MFWPNVITNKELLCSRDTNPWPHRSRGEDGDDMGMCAECHEAHCPGQLYAGRQMAIGDMVDRKKHGKE